MYYNSNKSSNDYYNSYKREIAELEAYRKEENLHKIIKLIVSIITLAIIIGGIYVYNTYVATQNQQKSYISTPEVTSNEALPAIVLNEKELPQSVQLRESAMLSEAYIRKNATDSIQEDKQTTQKIASNINEKDIALIVQIIMAQMNNKPEATFEKQLEDADTRTYAKKSLKESNHYNKVVLTKTHTSEVQNASLMELSNNLDTIVNETEEVNSNYSNQLKKEVVFREREMRFIIVQEGDTLSKIAKKAYGNSDDYPKIFSANPEIIKNPNQIYAGQRLRIPS